jgi:hypothetical protein
MALPELRLIGGTRYIQDRPTYLLMRVYHHPQSIRRPTMLNPIRGIALVQLKSLLRGFLQECSLPFGSVLTVKEVVAMIQEELVETCDRIFTPLAWISTNLKVLKSR